MDTYDELLDAYVEELRLAREAALQWWDDTLRAEPKPSSAYANVRSRWPAGPVSYPRVLAVYRKFYLLCDALNQTLSQANADDAADAGWGEEDAPGVQILQPRQLLLENLELRDRDLAEFMSALVLSPIGIDSNGYTS